MEGNRDDAEKCIEFAIRYLQDGNRDKAEKLLMKSERLFPTSKAKGTQKCNYFKFRRCSH